MKKPRTPSEIAATKVKKQTYSFSLIKNNMDKIIALARESDLPVSDIIDEAIKHYLSNIKDNKSN